MKYFGFIILSRSVRWNQYTFKNLQKLKSQIRFWSMIVVSKSWNVLSIHHGRISKAAFVNCFLVFAELWTASYVLLCIPKTTIALHKLTQCNIEQGVIGFLFICTRRTEMLSWARILPTFFCICFIFQIAKKHESNFSE